MVVAASRNVYKDLGKNALKDKFVFPENTEKLRLVPEAPRYDEPEIGDDLDAENKAVVKANDRTKLLLEKAVAHVQTFDSLDTAQQIIGRAYNVCPSIFNKRLIANANRSLKAAIKTDAWMKSRRRKKHVDEHTRKKNLDAFHEKVAEAVASVQLDSDKRNKRLFSNIKQQFAQELPVLIKKGYTLKQAHVVAMLTHAPSKRYRSTRLEGGLFLLENVDIIGVSRTKYRNTLAKAETVANARGQTVYETPLPRPSQNIDWYVFLNFEAGVTFAGFADSAAMESDGDGSYEDYIRNRDQNKVLQTQLKTQRLREIRERFAKDNEILIQDRAALVIILDNLIGEIKVLDEQFAGLTMTSESDPGLTPKQYDRLDTHLDRYLNEILKSGKTMPEARLTTLHQRLDARTKYYARKDVAEEATVIRRKIRFIDEELAIRKQRYANELGLVSSTKVSIMPG